MHSRFPVKTNFRPLPSFSPLPYTNGYKYPHQVLWKIVCSDKKPDRKFKFKQVSQYLGDRKWKLNDIDPNAVQESINQWLSRTQIFLNEFTSPLVKNVQERRPRVDDNTQQDVEGIFIAEQTVDSRTPNGDLSVAAILSIEQFSRMNGLTGQQMQKLFKALVSEPIYNDGRNLVEYCCFRFLSRNSSEVHPCLKEPAFQRLIFLTMLAWEQPYSHEKDSHDKVSEKNLFQRLVGEEAFARIAPAVPGVADWCTAHNLFKALAGDEQGISFSLWSTYINELLKVHEGRDSYRFQEHPQVSSERILCLGSSRKRPVLKWENNMAWPGKVTLTDKALYFEVVGGQKDAIRLDLTKEGSRVEKTRVGPLGSNLFDSAISVTSGPDSGIWILEFVDFGGEMRRDVWYAFVNEVTALYKFIREYGPKDDDQSMQDVYGACKGKARATAYATNAIARLQALQYMRKLLDEPTKLVPFSYLQIAPYGDVVSQTLAVNCWGGPLGTKFMEGDYQPGRRARSIDGTSENNYHVFDIDGSVYLRDWMTSPSWASSASIMFWKNSVVKRGIVLSKSLVVAEMNLVEKAATTCKDKFKEVEKTKATINAAMIEGIPSNIDLFKELLLPLTITAQNFERLRRWEDPLVTASFLAFVYTLIFRNLLSYVFPGTLMILAAGMLLLKGLKEQGRLGRFFGKVTIHDQPPSNTIQKIIAVKEAMHEVEKYLQNVNVTLLKIRSVILSGQTQITTEVALVLLLTSTILLTVPFKYILAFLIFDLFTRELHFRRQMVLRFMSLLKERWDSVPAAPVVVLTYEVEDGSANHKKELNKIAKADRSQISS